jgi:SAM-dependent methyltransferase
MSTTDTAQIIERQRAMWTAGDYPDIATTIEDVAEGVVAAAGISAGDDVLDVATGSGNAALAAARAGARVTGLDLTPKLLEVARRRAAEAGVEIAFDEGDAQELPYEDGRFDRVTSVFGVMFAPDQARAASELLRVVKPGGTIAVAAWTPDGLNGQMLVTMGRHLPPPPPGFQPPPLWGTEDRVRELFADAAEVRCERRRAERAVDAESIDAFVDWLENVLGPVILAKQALEPEGRWDAARRDLVELYERFNEADGGRLHAQPEYLLTVVRRAG